MALHADVRVPVRSQCSQGDPWISAQVVEPSPLRVQAEQDPTVGFEQVAVVWTAWVPPRSERGTPSIATVAGVIGARAEAAAALLVGVTTTNVRGGSARANQADFEAKVGHQSIRRCYANQRYDVSPYWLQTFLGAVDVDLETRASLRTTHVSWNPDCRALTDENPNGFDPTGLQAYLAERRPSSALAGYGVETRKNLDFLLSCPPYARCIWTPWHEADHGQGGPGYNFGRDYARFRLGLQIVADLVHAFGNPLWSTCLVLTTYAWKGNSGAANDPANFWPGPGYVDIMGIDAYNEGSVDGSRWDSLAVSLGYPADGHEARAYQARYGGPGSIDGMKTTDSSGMGWSNGFLGWCEVVGVRRWLLAEFGTMRNVARRAPSWVGGVASRAQWVESALAFVEAYNADPRTAATCVGVEYLLRGRTYAGPTALAEAVHLLADGSPHACLGERTAAALPAAGNAVGETGWLTDSAHIVRWSGSAWVDVGPGLVESWELWWNEDGSGWDGADSAYAVWAAITARHQRPPATES